MANKKIKPIIKPSKETIKEAELIITELNDSQKCFCREYCFCKNKTRAYQIAYPESDYDSARTAGPRLFANVCIQEYIKYLNDNLEELTGVTKARNIQELAKIAYSSIGNIFKDWMSREDYATVLKENPSIIECIESIDTKTLQKNLGTKEEPDIYDVEYVKIKLYSKPDAIDKINKMMGYNEPLKFTGDINLNQLPKVIIESNE
jgi:hypothetical protein